MPSARMPEPDSTRRCHFSLAVALGVGKAVTLPAEEAGDSTALQAQFERAELASTSSLGQHSSWRMLAALKTRRQPLTPSFECHGALHKTSSSCIRHTT